MGWTSKSDMKQSKKLPPAIQACHGQGILFSKQIQNQVYHFFFEKKKQTLLQRFKFVTQSTIHVNQKLKIITLNY